MNENDITTLAKAVLRGNRSQDSHKEICKIFKNKSCKTILREATPILENTVGRVKNRLVVILVLALLRRRSTKYEALKNALIDAGWMPLLYGGLRMLLCSNNPDFHINVAFTDASFPNKYSFLTRFEGEFYEPEYCEILYAVKLIADTDPFKFENLVFEDSTHLVLFNLSSWILEYFPSRALTSRLLKAGDTIQANTGFYYAVWPITKDVRDYAQQRNHPNLPNTKSKKEINHAMEQHLETLDHMLQPCTPPRRTALLLNYILVHMEYPIQFGYWLMQAEYQPFLREQIISSKKIKNLRDVLTVTRLIHDFPSKNSQGITQKKNPLYAAILTVLKNFISTRNGIYSWDSKQEQIWKQICHCLPKRYLNSFGLFLAKTSSNLMVSPLDEMVRFQIYLEDKRLWDICQGMLGGLLYSE